MPQPVSILDRLDVTPEVRRLVARISGSNAVIQRSLGRPWTTSGQTEALKGELVRLSQDALELRERLS